MTVACHVFRKSKDIDVTMQTGCTETPQKDRQGRPAGYATQTHEFFTTQASPIYVIHLSFCVCLEGISAC